MWTRYPCGDELHGPTNHLPTSSPLRRSSPARALEPDRMIRRHHHRIPYFLRFPGATAAYPYDRHLRPTHIILPRGFVKTNRDASVPTERPKNFFLRFAPCLQGYGAKEEDFLIFHLTGFRHLKPTPPSRRDFPNHANGSHAVFAVSVSASSMRSCGLGQCVRSLTYASLMSASGSRMSSWFTTG